MKRKINKNPKQPTKSRKTTKSSKLALTLTIATLFIGVLFYTYRKLTPQPLQIAEISNANGTVNLSLETTTQSLTPNNSGTITLKYNAGSTHLTAADITINYDPTLIEVTPAQVVVSADFPTSLSSVKANNGTIKFAVGISAETTGKSGTGTLATIPFKTLSKTGNSSVTLADTSMVTTSENSATNSLREITNLPIAVATTQPSPDPSSSPITSPLASPIASPLQSPKTSPSADPSVKPSIAPSTTPSIAPSLAPTAEKPNKPTNLRYNCYDNGSMVTLRWDSVSGVDNYEITLDQITGDKDTKTTTTGTQKDLSIASNSKYNWSLRSIKDDVKSDEAAVKDFSCNGSITSAATPTPTPSIIAQATATPKPTPKPNLITKAVQSIVKPKSPSPTPIPSPVSTNQLITLNPSAEPGSLADVFKSPTPSIEPRTDLTKPSIFAKIFLGWQALFLKIVESLAK